MNANRRLSLSRCLSLLVLLAMLAGCGAAAARRAPLAVTPAAPAAMAAPPRASTTPVALATKPTPPATAAPPRASTTPVALATKPTTSSAAAPRESAVGEPFELALGEELRVAAAGLTLRFAGVPEDSRCPADSHCIWAGRAVVTIEASAGAEQPRELTLGLPGGITPDAPELQAVGAHTVRLVSLDPYPPTSGGPPLDYVATLIVEGR